MISQTDLRLIHLMIEKIDRLININQSYSNEEINNNYLISDSIQFEFEKLYEDSTRLSLEFLIEHHGLAFDSLRAIRNRVAHDYESVLINILTDTIRDDLPLLKKKLEEIIK